MNSLKIEAPMAMKQAIRKHALVKYILRLVYRNTQSSLSMWPPRNHSAVILGVVLKEY